MLSAAHLSILVLFDNNAYQEGLEASWGFACLVRGAARTVLFDTGADGAILLANMGKLGIDPKSMDVVMLSHPHWDHVDGLGALLAVHSDVEVYLPQSFPERYKADVRSAGARVVEVGGPVEICPDVYSTGEMSSERSGGPRYRDIVEQSLVLRSDQGLAVITGCAHPGIVNILEKVETQFEEDELLLAMGGFHLLEEQRLEGTVARLRELGLCRVAPCHCSGDPARELFAAEYGEDYLGIGVGATIGLL